MNLKAPIMAVTVLSLLFLTGCKTTKTISDTRLEASSVIKGNELQSAFAVLAPITIEGLTVDNRNDIIGMTLVDDFDAKLRFVFKGRRSGDHSKKVGDIYVGNSERVTKDCRKVKAGSLEAEQLASLLKEFREKNYDYEYSHKLWMVITAISK